MANCAHGFPQNECLICQTLGSSPGQATATKTKAAKAAEPVAALSNGRAAPTLATRDADKTPATRRNGGGMGMFWAILVAIAVGGLVIWAFAGLVSVAFHIAEFVALALVAGWVGYKLGHHRGRRGH